MKPTIYATGVVHFLKVFLSILSTELVSEVKKLGKKLLTVRVHIDKLVAGDILDRYGRLILCGIQAHDFNLLGFLPG